MRKDRRLNAVREFLSDFSGSESVTGWEIDLAAMPVTIGDDSAARPAVVMAVAEDWVLHADILARPPSEPEEVAALFESTLRDLADHAGRWPSTVTIRYAEIAPLLADRLEGAGVAVQADPMLEHLDDHLIDLRKTMGLPATRHAPSIPQTWAGWGLPPEHVGELFAAAAAFYRAAPWRSVTNEQILRCDTDGGADLTMSVIGEGGSVFGLAVYEDVRDLWRLYGPGTPEMAISNARGAMISFSLVDAKRVPAATRQEVKREGWEIADRGAYPDLTAMITPGSGLSRARARLLIDLLWSVPRFVDRHRETLEHSRPLAEPLAWRDPETGIELECSNSLYPEGEAFWPLPVTLLPCTPSGANAEPEAALHIPDDPEDLLELEAPAVERFERWLAERVEDDRARAECGSTASLFVESFLVHHQAVPLRAVTEYDLRLFLYEWYPRKVQDSDEAAEELTSWLARFFEYLMAEEGIDCPWAAEILTDQERFLKRWRSCPGSFWWDDGVAVWRRQAYDDLIARVLQPEQGVGDDSEDDDGIGVAESMLERELHRRWLVWRDDVIASGVTEPTAVRDELAARQREWERTPQDDLSGETPLTVVRAERERSDLR